MDRNAKDEYTVSNFFQYVSHIFNFYSGNWSGSSSSARQSIESDLRRNSSPEKRWSEAESDKSSKDSALSLDDYPPSTNSRYVKSNEYQNLSLSDRVLARI